MLNAHDQRWHNPLVSRRSALKVGAIGLGLGLSELSMLRTWATVADTPRAKSVIFIFLTGGLSHHDSFDMKPNAPSDVRGEFQPIETRTPGIQICEHLPLLAERIDRYALLRSMQTASSGHELACHMLLTGRLDLPPGFTLDKVPSANEWPSIPALVTYAFREHQQKMPPSIVLPESSVNEDGKVRPGQYAGRLGNQWDAWHVNITSKCPLGNGSCPDCFRFDGTPFEHTSKNVFDTPALALPEGGKWRFRGRVGLLDEIQRQQRGLKHVADQLDQHRQQAISVLVAPEVNNAFDVENADPRTLERYGKNKFGLSVLMAKRLVESSVKLVQVNLGKNSSWDTHRRNFVNLKEKLFPPMDRCLTALSDDLSASGLLQETLVVVTGEFGRTPKINKKAGRDHWGPVNTMLFACAGVRGGNVIGASDPIGAEPVDAKQTPENFAAAIYQSLGIPNDGIWIDLDSRPHKIYHGKPIEGLI